MDGLEEAIQDMFDEGWEDFIKDVEKKILASNIRLFAVLKKAKGQDFVDEFIQIMNMCKSSNSYVSIQRGCIGYGVKSKNGIAIPRYLLDCHTTDDGMVNIVSIPLRNDKFIQFSFLN